MKRNIALLLSLCASVHGEIRSFDDTLEASSLQLYESQGFIVNPGYVDLTSLVFSTDGSDFETDDGTDRYEGGDDTTDDASYYEPTDDLTDSQDNKKHGHTAGDDVFDDVDDGNRKLEEFGQHKMDEYVLDVLFFKEPKNCNKASAGCDWSKIGVGSSQNQWCCSRMAIDLGYCEPESLGRLIIDPDLYYGEHRYLTIPKKGSSTQQLDVPVMTSKNGTGVYTLVLANCYDSGRDVHVEGEYVWKNAGGYLPGNLYTEFYFLIFLTLVYAGLAGWYGYSMKKHQQSKIEIQKWVMGTISLGLIENILKCVDYDMWNLTGIRAGLPMYAWIFIGVIKRGISRCVLLMVSLGWGVVRDDLGETMKKIILLGVVYMGCSFSADVAAVVFVEELDVLSVEQEEEVYGIFEILALLTSIIDAVFIMWLLDSLGNTMEYLENMNQTMKLSRYLRLRLILLFSILFAVIWSVFTVVDTTMDTSILTEGEEWVLIGLPEANYIFVLLSIAILWRPNSRARDLAFVMELPSIGDDMVLDTTLATASSDDDTADNTGKLKTSLGLRIDDAVAS